MRLVLSLLLILPITASAQTITRVQLIPLSNYVGAVSASLTVASNYLYSQISEASGVTAEQVTNISQIISTITSNGVVLFTLTASNNLVTVFQARDITTSNGVVSFTMTTSNNLASLLSVNDTLTSNALRTAYLAADITTSNGAVAFTITASNVLRTDISNLQGATNGLVARVNNLDGATNGLTTRATNLEGATNGLTTRANNLEGATNGLTTRTGNLEGATNGLNSGVVGLLSRAVTNSDTRSISLSTLAVTSFNVINSGVSNLVGTNVAVRSGSSASNAFVGGTIWSTITAVANPTSNGTLAATVTIPIPAHTMTNSGDRVVARFVGVMPVAQANTNQFSIIINNGGPNVTLMDSGLQPSSNTSYIVEIHITRSGVASHIIDSHLDWGPGGGVPFAKTNRALVTTTTTNGLGLNLLLQSTARRQGSHTNLIARAWFDPAPR